MSTLKASLISVLRQGGQPVRPSLLGLTSTKKTTRSSARPGAEPFPTRVRSGSDFTRVESAGSTQVDLLMDLAQLPSQPVHIVPAVPHPSPISNRNNAAPWVATDSLMMLPFVAKNSQYTRNLYKPYLVGLAKYVEGVVPPHGPSTAGEHAAKSNALQERSKREVRYQYMRTRLSDHDLFMNYQSRDVERITMLLKKLAFRDDDTAKSSHPLYARPHYGELKPIPSSLTPESFTAYCAYLARGRFYYKNSSQLNTGIIPRFLLRLLSPDNEEMKPFRTVEAYNHAMHFFGIVKGQLNLAKRLLLAMNVDGCAPNTESFNIVLHAISRYSRGVHSQNPLKLALGILESMLYMGVTASRETWRYVYDTMDNLMARQCLLRLMAEARIPASHGLCRSVMRDIVAARASSPLRTRPADLVAEMEDLVDTEMAVYDVATVEYLIRVALTEQRYAVAFRVFSKYLSFEPDSPFRVRPSTMNLLLKAFSMHGRIDLCWATMNTFRYKTKHAIKPCPEAYRYLLAGIYNAGATEGWLQNVRIVLHVMKRKFGTLHLNRDINMLLVKFQSRALFEENRSTPLGLDGGALSEEETRLYKRINRDLHWKDGSYNTMVSDMPVLSPFRTAAHAAGYRESRPRKSITDVTAEEMERLTEGEKESLLGLYSQIRHFEEGVRRQAIQGSYSRKLAVLAGGMEASLSNELRERRIV